MLKLFAYIFVLTPFTKMWLSKLVNLTYLIGNITKYFGSIQSIDYGNVHIELKSNNNIALHLYPNIIELDILLQQQISNERKHGSHVFAELMEQSKIIMNNICAYIECNLIHNMCIYPFQNNATGF